MSLQTAALRSAIISALRNNRGMEKPHDAETALNNIADELSRAIETFVKSGEVTFTAGKVTGATPANGTLQGGSATQGEIS